MTGSSNACACYKLEVHPGLKANNTETGDRFDNPVAFYAGSVSLITDYTGLKKGFASIDAPVVIGLLVLFSGSILDILAATGPGCMDSPGGFAVFLSAGRHCAGKTCQASVLTVTTVPTSRLQ